MNKVQNTINMRIYCILFIISFIHISISTNNRISPTPERINEIVEKKLDAKDVLLETTDLCDRDIRHAFVNGQANKLQYKSKCSACVSSVQESEESNCIAPTWTLTSECKCHQSSNYQDCQCYTVSTIFGVFIYLIMPTLLITVYIGYKQCVTNKICPLHSKLTNIN